MKVVDLSYATAQKHLQLESNSPDTPTASIHQKSLISAKWDATKLLHPTAHDRIITKFCMKDKNLSVLGLAAIKSIHRHFIWQSI